MAGKGKKRRWFEFPMIVAIVVIIGIVLGVGVCLFPLVTVAAIAGTSILYVAYRYITCRLYPKKLKRNFFDEVHEITNG